MLTTKRMPATAGEILVEEFMQPMRLTQTALAEEMGVQRKHVNELCNNRRTHHRGDRAHPRPRVRQRPGFLAERAAAQRSVGGDEQPSPARADRTRQAPRRCGVTSVASPSRKGFQRRNWPFRSRNAVLSPMRRRELAGGDR
jgi:hypothetical protein